MLRLNFSINALREALPFINKISIVPEIDRILKLKS
jgi:hypothetical protein